MSVESSEHALSAEASEDQDSDAGSDTATSPRARRQAAWKKRATSPPTTSRNFSTLPTSTATLTSRSATDAPTSPSWPRKNPPGWRAWWGATAKSWKPFRN